MAHQVPHVLRATARPILSASLHEARRRALNLYRAWYREVRDCHSDGQAVLHLFYLPPQAPNTGTCTLRATGAARSRDVQSRHIHPEGTRQTEGRVSEKLTY